jgi:hypothetical protein
MEHGKTVSREGREAGEGAKHFDANFTNFHEYKKRGKILTTDGHR